MFSANFQLRYVVMLIRGPLHYTHHQSVVPVQNESLQCTRLPCFQVAAMSADRKVCESYLLFDLDPLSFSIISHNHQEELVKKKENIPLRSIHPRFYPKN